MNKLERCLSLRIESGTKHLFCTSVLASETSTIHFALKYVDCCITTPEPFTTPYTHILS